MQNFFRVLLGKSKPLEVLVSGYCNFPFGGI